MATEIKQLISDLDVRGSSSDGAYSIIVLISNSQIMIMYHRITAQYQKKKCDFPNRSIGGGISRISEEISHAG